MALQPNEPIEISAVENGFLVRSCGDYGRASANASALVFSTMQSLMFFLEEHFSFRCKHVEVDT
jgi:hypothetical protein